MKKFILAMVIFIIAAQQAFAEFEGTFGLYGGIGNAAGLGMSMQAGFLVPNRSAQRWGMCFDALFGYRYGLSGQTFEYYSGVGNLYYTEEYDSFPLELIYGVLGQYYLSPNVAISAGPAHAFGFSGFINCFRSEINYVFEHWKLGIGFDYIWWDNEKLPSHVPMPPGYRISFHLRLRMDWQTFAIFLEALAGAL